LLAINFVTGDSFCLGKFGERLTNTIGLGDYEMRIPLGVDVEEGVRVESSFTFFIARFGFCFHELMDAAAGEIEEVEFAVGVLAPGDDAIGGAGDFAMAPRFKPVFWDAFF
jgi:hypothetical protein